MLPPTLRIARPTNSVPAMKTFYTEGLGLSIIASFENHNGFDGVILGHPEYTWHLEFTYQHGVTVERAPSKENLLVFYFEDKQEWDAAVEKLEKAGGVQVKSENPWWDPPTGATFEDPEGWRVVLYNSKWR